MRHSLINSAVAVCSFFFFSVFAPAQQSTPQAGPFVRRSFALLTGGMHIKDLTLNGTATLYSGSTSESGPITLTAVGVVQSRFDAKLPSWERIEVRTISNGLPVITTSGPSGAFSVFGSQDLGILPVWFFPANAMAPALAASGFVSSYVGLETKLSTAVEHVQLVQPSSGPIAYPISAQDIYLSLSHLPVAIDFNLPNSLGVLNIPVEIRYSDYQHVQSRQVPYHIQVYKQGVLLWDIQLSSDAINTGATVTATAASPTAS
jgi:hypothetical protein